MDPFFGNYYDLDKEHANQRDIILFHEPYDESKYGGGVRDFDGLTYKGYQQLLELRVIDPGETQNDSPSVREIAEFLKKHPNFTAHGYATSKKRDDYRVSFEGVECGEGYTLSDVQDFFSLFKYPDSLTVDEHGMYCWYD